MLLKLNAISFALEGGATGKAEGIETFRPGEPRDFSL